jgi:hypothetical protein
MSFLKTLIIIKRTIKKREKERERKKERKRENFLIKFFFLFKLYDINIRKVKIILFCGILLLEVTKEYLLESTNNFVKEEKIQFGEFST